jgi:hypothetical protein
VTDSLCVWFRQVGQVAVQVGLQVLLELVESQEKVSQALSLEAVSHQQAKKAKKLKR